MSILRLRSPAKLNLYLKVVNKRPDGFHNIETVFERVDLYDDIILKDNTSGRISIFCNHPDVPTGPKNLVYKVALLLKEKFNISNGVHIIINKRIPVAAGLAGGSSNAATVLQGLNKLWKIGLSQEKLVDCAKLIGSDVAFFLYDCSFALGTQRGDKIKVLKIASKLYHIIVVPKIKMYTWRVYGSLKKAHFSSGLQKNSINTARRLPVQSGHTKMLTKKSDDVSILIHHLGKNDVSKIGALMKNDLEKPVFEICPNLLQLKQKLNSMETQGVMVSGSGPSVYATTRTWEKALAIQKILAKRYAQVFAVKTL